MTKTSTTEQSVNLPLSMSAIAVDAETDTDLDLFYDELKGRLDELITNPQDETIDRILAYSSRK